jgi:hypothetical protein
LREGGSLKTREPLLALVPLSALLDKNLMVISNLGKLEVPAQETYQLLLRRNSLGLLLQSLELMSL